MTPAFATWVDIISYEIHLSLIFCSMILLDQTDLKLKICCNSIQYVPSYPYHSAINVSIEPMLVILCRKQGDD